MYELKKNWKGILLEPSYEKNNLPGRGLTKVDKHYSSLLHTPRLHGIG